MDHPPQPKTVATIRRYHDLCLPDPYAWLRTEAWQAALRDPGALDADIRAHLEAENAYTQAILAPTAALRGVLKQELRGRMEERAEEVPLPDGPYAYYRRYAPDRQHPLFCRRRRDHADAPEEVLLDGNTAAEGHAFFRVAAAVHSPDHRAFAYAVDLTGSEYHRLRVYDIARDETVDTGVDRLGGDLAWANDGRTLVYTVLDANHRPSRVQRIHLDELQPHLVYEEADPAFALEVELTQSRRFITITAADHSDTTEVRLIDADAPEAPLRLVRAREPGLSYSVGERDGELIMLTNADGAIDYKVVAAPASAPDKTNWRDVVPHRPGVYIRRVIVLESYLVRLELADALPRIVIRAHASGDEHTVHFPEGDAAYALGLVPGYEFDSDVLRLSYSSPRQPRRTYDYDMTARDLLVRKEQVVPSGHDPDDYVVQRLWLPSHDGVEVPVTLMHRADFPPTPTRPLLLYGYGAYGMAIPDGFSPDRLSLVDRGMVYAIAHVRGGSERGYGWYLDGKLGNKPNTFRDFIAVAEGLIDQGMASAGDIVANGRSAGGLLVGAVTNMRPDLFRAVVAEVPFVDVLNTMSDAALPLTPPEWSEWGNPIADREACHRIASYSPYDNVARRPYPHVLATAGIADPRVTYWEPAKWIARLRANTAGTGQMLLHTNMTAGHAGSAGRFARLDEVALVQAFILYVCGLDESPVATTGRVHTG